MQWHLNILDIDAKHKEMEQFMEIQSLNESFMISSWLYMSSLHAQILLHKKDFDREVFVNNKKMIWNIFLEMES